MDNLCLLCSSMDTGNQINILNNEYKLQTVNEVLNMSIQREEYLPPGSCKRCWVKIGAYNDFQQKCKNTINHHKDSKKYRTNHTEPLLPSPKTNTGDSIINMETNGLIISDVRSGYGVHEINDSGSDNVDNRLLLPMLPINDVAHYNSETGGYLKNGKAVQSNQIYICSYCNIKYKRIHFYKKHILKHEREETRKNHSSNMQLKTFKCDTCDAEFSKKKLLKVHMYEHKAQFVCITCSQSFILEDKYKWHIAQCDGKHRAITDDSQPFRRRTRSQSVASSGFVSSFAETDYQTSKWVADVNTYDDDNDDCRSVRSDTTIGSTFSGVSLCSQLTTRSSISIRSTYSTKPTLTTEALLNTKNILSNMPQTRHTIKQMAIVAMDINMRESNQPRCQTPFRKIPLVKYSRKLMDCFCGYRPKDLQDMVEHEFKIHNSMLCYRCRECNTYFTKPEYLRMHEERDHINQYKCYMCGTMVKSKSELRLHYEYHATKTHDCIFCEMTFLKIHELQKHIKAHPKIFKEETVCRILESYTYIEKPVKTPTISDGKLKIYERIQKKCPIKRKSFHFCNQRLGGRVKTYTSTQDRLVDKLFQVPVYPEIIPETCWEQRTQQMPSLIHAANNIREELDTESENNSSHNSNEVDFDETNISEIFVPDFDGEYDKCSINDSENNNSIHMDDEISENLDDQNKISSFNKLDELNFFSTEDLYSNARSSRSCSSEDSAGNDEIIPIENSEIDINSSNKKQNKTLINKSLSPSTSRKTDVLESNTKKYTINKRLKRKFFYKIRTKEMKILKSPIPSYNELVHQSNKGFKLSSHKCVNGPWRITYDNI